ncbi:B12-binding domain-containing radical SAM protein [Anaerolentibacter hominis]|uniref:B12-binding domain-containing radical SAM protein n=1 Tax=Anaerolentibacter hominis TaxID=3079009 RepID=UPI0031B84E4D
MNVLLAAVNAKYIHSNPALYCLRAYASEYRESVNLTEYTINMEQDDILMDIFKRKPDFLAFSCYIWNINVICGLVREVHKILPDTLLWLGGPEVSYDAPARLKLLPELTGIMVGEGEETFRELMAYYIEGKGALGDIRGLAYTDEGKLIQTGEREPLDLSLLPFPYEDCSEFENRIIYYETSRGCPFSCSYCLSSIEKKVRLRDFELVKKELSFFLDRKVKQVKFVDRTFNCSRPHTKAIWEFIRDHDNGITNFHFEITADLLSEEELDLLNQLRPGLVQLEIGVQSSNERTIGAIRRKMDLDKLKHVVSRIQEGHNVHQHLDLIAGLPYEGFASFAHSFDDVYAMKPDQLQLGFLKVLKGSYMYESRESNGLVYRDRPPYEVLYTKWISYGELLELKKVEEMVEAYYNSGQFSSIIRYLEHFYRSKFNLYLELGNFYEEKKLDKISHSRMSRYSILLEFVKEKEIGDIETAVSLLIYDLYARENLKSRPEFAPDTAVYKDRVREFYHNPDNILCYLEGYQGYDIRQISRMTHMEHFSIDIQAAVREGVRRERDYFILFDYQEREPLHHQARTWEIEA